MDDVFKIAFDLAKQFQFSSEIDFFLTNVRNPTFTEWSNTLFFKFDCSDGNNNLRHVLHDLCRVVTIGENIQKIIRGYEEESGESNSLLEHESSKSSLANLQFLFNLLKLRENPVFDTEIKSNLILVTFRENLFNILIDSNELLGFIRKLLLYLIGVDEKILEERPSSLYFTDFSNNFLNVCQSLVPVNNFFLESSKVSVREHSRN